ncbi:hypothetical protein L3Q82_014299, partial [Scortum barcoo]
MYPDRDAVVKKELSRRRRTRSLDTMAAEMSFLRRVAGRAPLEI